MHFVNYTIYTSISSSISCGMEDLCKGNTLNCRASDPCKIECDAKATCSSGATVNGMSSTDVTVLCDQHDSCKGMYVFNMLVIEIVFEPQGLEYIWCGTGRCILICKSSTSCEGIGIIDASRSTSFECYGHCPSTVPSPFAITMSPTSKPSATPTSPSYVQIDIH